mgnify:CR=1 FL=1
MKRCLRGHRRGKSCFGEPILPEVGAFILNSNVFFFPMTTLSLVVVEVRLVSFTEGLTSELHRRRKNGWRH